MIKYEILLERCIHSGNCVQIAPTLFAMDDDGVVRALKEGTEGADDQEQLLDAADSCPARAIVHDE